MNKADKKIWNDFISILESVGISANEVYLNSTGYISGIFDCIKTVTRYIKGHKVLDYGCGTGLTTYILKKYGYDVYGFDVCDNKENLAVFKESNWVQAVLWARAGIKASFGLASEKYDGVLLHAVYEHLENKEATLKEINKRLYVGGLLFIFRTPHANSWQEKITGAHTDIEKGDEILQAVQRNGFEIITNGYQDIMFWSVSFQSVFNFLFPLFKIINDFLLETPIKKYAHNIFIIARKV